MNRKQKKITAFWAVPALAVPALASFAIAAALLSACELYSYGKIGGAFQTGTYNSARSQDYPHDDGFTEIMDFLSGVWYSHYAGIGRLDGYRIGKWGEGGAEFKRVMGDDKLRQILPPDAITSPSVRVKTYRGTGNDPLPNNDQSRWPLEDGENTDYWLFYDPSVYGQTDEGQGGRISEGGEEGGFGFLGIVRAVNIFSSDRNRGALIIEYIEGCAPAWLERYPESSGGKVPFYGIYYRVLDDDTVQLANAVDLAALYAGDPYYTETATLEEAVDRNGAVNEAEFISWGIVIPQDREKTQGGN